MKPRRSRFGRIYHRLTRWTPNRRAQWHQIGTLRPHGSVGRPVPAGQGRVHVSARWEHEQPLSLEFQTAWPEPESINSRPGPESLQEVSPGSGAAVAALTASLFLLACAYAAFSGWMHSYDDGFAYLGILGAVGSLLAAGIGVCLAASELRRRHSGKFLSVCAISLAAMYGVLLFFAASGR